MRTVKTIHYRKQTALCALGVALRRAFCDERHYQYNAPYAFAAALSSELSRVGVPAEPVIAGAMVHAAVRIGHIFIDSLGIITPAREQVIMYVVRDDNAERKKTLARKFRAPFRSEFISPEEAPFNPLSADFSQDIAENNRPEMVALIARKLRPLVEAWGASWLTPESEARAS